jgi:hypothetical protein
MTKLRDEMKTGMAKEPSLFFVMGIMPVRKQETSP